MSDTIVMAQGPHQPIAAAEIDAAEARLHIHLPAGYREYMGVFGEGMLEGPWVRIYPPHRIERELQEWRERVNEYWFWDAGRNVLTKAQVLQSVVIADSMDGDELVVHPDMPGRIFMLPRHSEEIVVVGGDVTDAIAWLSERNARNDAEAGQPPEQTMTFTPFDTRVP